MDKILFIRQNHKDFAGRASYLLSRTVLKQLICVSGLLVLLQFAGISSLYAQGVKISLNKENATLEEIFQEIETKTGYKFVYNTSEINRNERASIQETEQELNEILQNLFRTKQNISFRISNKHIALFKAQIKKISGTVLDPQGETVIGANVLVKGTTNGTITDIDGKFSLEAAEGDILQISYIGYNTQEITLGKQSTLKITLKEDQQALEEVVVIGYGAVKKKDLTGAITQVKTDKYATQQSTNVLDMLNGTVAGFNSNIGTSASGASEMEIRGPSSLSANNSPLVVLDGVIFNGSINDINPSDIETVDVLKDASSAAVYGSRSAAGVVIINTKRGKSEKMTINFSAQLGLTDFTNEIRPNDLDGFIQRRQDFQRRINPDKPEGYYNNPNNLPEGIDINTWQKYDVSYQEDPIRTWMTRINLREIEQENFLNGNTYDWFAEATRPGLRQNYNVNISGGIGKTKYYWSLGYTDNQGYLKGDEYKTIRSRMNADTKVTDFLTVGINAQFSNKDESNEAIKLSDIRTQSPLGQPYDENGELKWYPHDDSGVEKNPFLLYKERDKFNITQNLFANIYADLQLPFGFSYKVSFINRYDWQKNYYYDPSTIPTGNKTGGFGQRINSSLYEWQIDNIISWKKAFGIHDFYATFLYNAEKKQTWKDTGENINFTPSEALGFHQLGAGSSPSIKNEDTYSTGTAIMGRLNYTLMNRYLLTLSIRRDGYSAFGLENPYATFPSGALAWNLSDEAFFNVKWINNLKIRASYGINGNRDIGIYDALAKLETTKYLTDGTFISGIYSNSLANRFLKWEKTKALNLGIDFSVLENRLTGSLDYYDMTTNDLLLKRSLPTIIGYENVMSNMGELKNKGFEMTLNSYNIQNENFYWNSTFTFSFNRNKIKHLYGEMIDILDKNGNIIGQREADDISNSWFIGQSIDRIWDYRFDGIYQLGEEDIAKSFGKAPGDTKLYDLNGDGVSTQEDKIFQGYTKPRYRLGLRNDFTIFKNFQISCFIRADLGHWGKNGLLSSKSQVEDRRNEYALPYWTPENPTNKYTRLNTVDTPEYSIYESRSFVRLQDLSIAYNIPENITKNLKVGRCKVYLSGRNLITFTKWSGWDPESENKPMPRIFTFGIDVTL
ncbi:TonB-dependent receptor [Parabacteroides acidifaciens]|uniref:TonB-dependent receptor n=1 Tax=Parabacteroides acidifaciens TaxID=2290935 RepID=A0A3D8H9R4_9BACT|nr:SusC/RagA family TonB-linked outer membrane protein [Parabacteroides acidifaciens]MBC8603872.1 TonB-dependent receptor [Parabacteroides acidifaciens]RDU47382.1 TonB-dependent receptor [Parabacteroides acidifaciens]